MCFLWTFELPGVLSLRSGDLVDCVFKRVSPLELVFLGHLQFPSVVQLVLWQAQSLPDLVACFKV